MMKLEFDLDGATNFELNAISEFFKKLAQGDSEYTDRADTAAELWAAKERITELEEQLKVTESHKGLAADASSTLIEETNDVPPPAVEVETSNIPWDARIHSANKSKNADGTWRYARKPKNFETKEQWMIYIQQIEEELRDAPVAVEETNDVPPPAGEVETDVDAIEAFSNIKPPIEETNDVPPPAGEVEYPEKSFGELMSLITTNIAVQEINTVLSEMDIAIPEGGKTALPILKSNHPERVSEAFARLQQKIEEK